MTVGERLPVKENLREPLRSRGESLAIFSIINLDIPALALYNAPARTE
jgi:hypothetical protein